MKLLEKLFDRFFDRKPKPVIDLDAPFRQTGRTTRMLKEAIQRVRHGSVYVCGISSAHCAYLRSIAASMSSLEYDQIKYITPGRFDRIRGLRDFSLFIDHAVTPEDAYKIGCLAKSQGAFIYR